MTQTQIAYCISQLILASW